MDGNYEVKANTLNYVNITNCHMQNLSVYFTAANTQDNKTVGLSMQEVIQHCALYTVVGINIADRVAALFAQLVKPFLDHRVLVIVVGTTDYTELRKPYENYHQAKRNQLNTESSDLEAMGLQTEAAAKFKQSISPHSAQMHGVLREKIKALASPYLKYVYGPYEEEAQLVKMLDDDIIGVIATNRLHIAHLTPKLIAKDMFLKGKWLKNTTKQWRFIAIRQCLETAELTKKTMQKILVLQGTRYGNGIATAKRAKTLVDEARDKYDTGDPTWLQILPRHQARDRLERAYSALRHQLVFKFDANLQPTACVPLYPLSDGYTYDPQVHGAQRHQNTWVACAQGDHVRYADLSTRP